MRTRRGSVGRDERRAAGLAALVVLMGVQSAAVAQRKAGGVAPPAPLPQSALVDVPVREVTVFKDGHAFVLHEGSLPTVEGGQVVLNSLPTPILGTFWAYSGDPKVRLTGVVAGTRSVSGTRPVRDLRDVLRANIGRRASIREHNGDSYAATIVEMIDPNAAPPAGAGAQALSASPPAAGGPLVMLRRFEGVRIIGVDQVRDVLFGDDPSTEVATVGERDVLALRLDWGQAPPEDSAAVGMVYLQKGIRWIPNYRITIDGAGQARVELQATLINEMVDLEDVLVNLVIGVPSFRFADTIDPIALQRTVTQLSQYFTGPQQRGGFAFSNAIQTQTVRMGEYRQSEQAAEGTGDDDFSAFSRHEDLFIFPVQGVTLRKGERMVVPVVEFTLAYEDVFTLDVPFLPPADVRGNLTVRQQHDLAVLLNQPKVMHKLRLRNSSQYPLTTAPALILREGRLLAQGIMTYTAVGARTDLEVTAAVDVAVSKDEREEERTPGAAKWRNEELTRVRLSGTLGLTNRRGKAVTVEVTRFVLGNVDSAGQDGVITKANMLEESGYVDQARLRDWWGMYNWPTWWNRFNGLGRITWTARLEPGQRAELTYTWHYYWN